MAWTLKQIRTVKYGETLGQEDLDYANQLLAQGHLRTKVADYVRGWAQEYNRVAWCETKAAQQFERDAYG